MKRLKLLAPLLLVLLLLTGCSGPAEAPVQNTPAPTPEDAIAADVDWAFYNAKAETFVTAMADGNFDTAVSMFGEAMAEAADEAALEGIWDSIAAQAGAFVSVYEIENLEADEFFISFLTAQHENSGVTLRIVFSAEGLIMGLGIDGFPALEEPSITQHDGFTEYPVIIGAGTAFPLSGILAMPDDLTGPVPAVVIVSGSGPNDMDGSGIGAPIYRELAHYLAANGVAVIRNDKRTLTHGLQLVAEFGDSLTVWEESIEDALFAVALLREDPRIDPDRIYLVGHSLGGLLAPRIHEMGGDFAGLILMAGSPRDLLEIAIEQVGDSIAATLEMGLATEEDLTDLIEQLEALREVSVSFAHLSIEEIKKTELPLFGGSAYYFYNLRQHPFERYAAHVTVPVLVLHPEKDFQVLADVDFVLLQEIFAGHENVEFRLYEGLNHAFMPTTATNFVEHAESVMTPGHVDTVVFRDIVEWILSR
ncbi:MAG: alpha/beta fold hydrolase [Oscillospiraceae bacterium]|nr:alpha/beta fold hydrolase [Oscillospiraceae bacterium]